MCSIRSPAPLLPAPLLAHHAALVHHLHRVETLPVRPVLQDLEPLLHERRGVGGHGQDVDGLVEAGVRVQVRAEPHADRLEVLHEVVLREVRGAVERRVLQEVRVAELVVVLQHGARVHDQPQLGALLRPHVLADVVADPVRQGPDLHPAGRSAAGAASDGAGVCAPSGRATATRTTRERARGSMRSAVGGGRSARSYEPHRTPDSGAGCRPGEVRHLQCRTGRTRRCASFALLAETDRLTAPPSSAGAASPAACAPSRRAPCRPRARSAPPMMAGSTVMCGTTSLSNSRDSCFAIALVSASVCSIATVTRACMRPSAASTQVEVLASRSPG